MSANIQGPGGSKEISHQIGAQSTHSAAEGDLEGFGKVTQNLDASSILSQAAQTTQLPSSPQTQTIEERTSSQVEGGDEGDSDVEGSDDEDKEKKEAKEEEAAQRGAISRVSDVDAKERREQQEGFARRLEQMAKMGEIKSMQMLMDLAYGEFGDITDAYDGIRYVQEKFVDSKEEAVKNLSNSSRSAGDVMFKENAPDIRAGWIFGTQDPDSLEAYRENVIRFNSVEESFGAIMDRVKGNPKAFKKDVDKLLQSIKVDMAAAESTLEPAHLRKIMDGLFKVQMCGQVERDSRMLLQNMQELYGIEPAPENGTAEG